MIKDIWDNKGSMTLTQALDAIRPLDQEAMVRCKAHWDSIGKPLYSLGKLETETARIAGMTGDSNVVLDKKALVIMCADHGVLEEGVSQSPVEVTAIVAENFMTMQASASIMARQASVDVFPVDIAVAQDTRIINRKIAYGTNNMAKGPAMTRAQAIQGIETGIRMVEVLKQNGYQIVCTGEMGVGNTTATSAMAAVMLGAPVETVTGRGSGLTDQGLEKKIQVIRNVLAFHEKEMNPEDPIDVLSRVGGYEIAGMAGLYIGGAACGLPVVVDGVISAVAALLAVRIDARVRDYIMPSHVSKEPAGQMLLDALGMTPFLTCGMHLGEGSGGVMLMPALDLALAVYHSMGTFEDIHIDAYEPYEK